MKILEEDFLVFIVDLDQMRMVDKNILKVDTNGTKNNLLSLFLVNEKKKRAHATNHNVFWVAIRNFVSFTYNAGQNIGNKAKKPAKLDKTRKA